MNYWTQNKNNVYVAAHRGWCAKYPENTMVAFRAAMELGVDQIETDVESPATASLY
jgi:glycerophosphoryl diester phosphodiesterase